MGLSCETRVLKTYRALVAIHEEVDPTTRAIWSESKPFVRKIQDSCAQLIGMLIESLDARSDYWLVGESETGFRALIRGEVFIAEPPFEDRFLALAHGASEGSMPLELFAAHMGFSETTKQLAAWWHLWGLVPALLYPVNRHRRGFTSSFRREWRRLVAHIMLLRESLGGGADEIVLLWKYQLFCSDSRKWNEKIEWLRAMTQKQLEAEVLARNEKRANAQRESEASAISSPLVDPVRGDVPSEDELIAQVCKAVGCDESAAMKALFYSDGDVKAAADYIKRTMKTKVPRARRGSKSSRQRNKRG